MEKVMLRALTSVLLSLALGLAAANVAAQAPIVSSVVAQGVGKDPELAAKNAAENALTQVVGQFIDSEKQISKRAEIVDGIRSETKYIDTKTRAYSQGSVQSFDILNVETRDGLTYLTARVGVRVEDFRAYISRRTEGKAEVKEGIFAQVATTTDREATAKTFIFSKFVPELINGTVVKFRVGTPALLVDSPARGRFAASDDYRMTCDDFKKYLSTNTCAQLAAPTFETLASMQCIATHFRFDAAKSIAIPIKISLDDDFAANLTNTLKNISSNKGSTEQVCSGDSLCVAYFESLGNYFSTGKIEFYEIGAIKKADLLSPSQSDPQDKHIMLQLQKHMATPPAYEIELQDANGNVTAKTISRLPRMMAGASATSCELTQSQGSFEAVMLNAASPLQVDQNFNLVVRRETSAWLVLQPTPDQLKSTKSVVVRFKK